MTNISELIRKEVWSKARPSIWGTLSFEYRAKIQNRLYFEVIESVDMLIRRL